MKSMNIYHPYPNSDSYDRFYPLNLAKDLDTIARFLNTGKYQEIEEKNDWEPLPVEVQSLDTKRGDFLGIVAHHFTCNDRAWKILEPLIKQNVKLFPIGYKQQNYFLIKVINIIDCLDYTRADVLRCPETERVLGINKYAFKEDLIQNEHLFALPEMRFDILASQEFKDSVEKNGLEGLLFRQLA
jgi:hypothetical protein